MEIYKQFIMLDQFHVRPWEYSEDHEVYKEDIANMISMKHIQNEAERYNMEKERWKSEVKAKRQSW